MKNAQKTLEKQIVAAEAEKNKLQATNGNEPDVVQGEAVEADEQAQGKKEPVTLNRQQIDEWKKQYGKVFRTIIGSDAFIWHRLNRKDYVSLMMDDSVSEDEDERLYERQEMACKKAILWPENVDEILQDAGCIASNLGGVIMECSGFRIPVTDEM